ncbi:unnamed protein product, partial [Mesorhabditis belari]|uniref:Uncharacterized protein n=1 Tax=Mesorhabditis belari TaxID=2138241 RepID=A0AAF3J3F7_9BILA
MKIFFELEYYDNGWFRRHCKKVNRSTNLLQSFIPFLSPVTEEILQVVVDNSRHLLFALTKRSSLQVYDLGVKGNACTKITNLTSGQIIHEASAMSGGQHDPSMFSNIIRIIPLYAENSHQLNLLAVTARGVRLYFSVLPKQAQPPQGQYVAHLSMSQMEARPICLRICHIRFAPGLCPTSTYRDPADGAYMSQASNSTCILATHPQGRFMLFAISDLYHPASRSFVETISEFMLNGPVWAIHVQSKPLCSSEAPMGDLIPPAQTHPFYRMHANAPEVITIFTSEEMGPVNALVLALMLLSSEKPVDQQHHDKALRLFYSLKDEPEMVDVDQVRDWNDANDSFRDWNARMRSPLRSSTPFHERTMASPMNLNGHSPIGTHDYSFTHGNSFYQFRPSKRHDALYAYFARLVAPLWSQPIVLVNDGRLHPLVSEASLNWLSHQLRLFLAAIDDNNLIPRQLPPQASDYTSLNAKFSAEAYARERSSILALHALIILTLETLALWAVAVEYGMHQVSASVDSNSLMLLSGRRLSDLVTGDSNLNNDLIKGLIKYFLGDEAGTRDLSDRLRNVCPTLYSKEDALITNATEMLDRALRQGLTLDSQNIVRTAVLYLKQSINKVSLPVVSQQLSQLQSYDAIVELCLLRAKKDDPKQLAIAAYRNGGVAEGNKEMAEASNRRENSYAVFRRLLEDVDGKLDAQTIRDQISKCVLASDDELAHAALFRWMLQNHQAEKIIQSKSQFVEQFLQHEIGRGGGHKYLDLLWRFYEKSNTFDKAAKLLVRLADCTTMPEITLDQRISYLSHAIMCAQSSTDSKIKEKIQEMRDKLDVANVQLSARQALASIATPQCRQAVKELDKSLFCTTGPM